MNVIETRTPFDEPFIASLRAGDMVYISGIIYTARDKAHQRISELLTAGEPLPFESSGQVIYYMGPSPAPAGKVIGAAGPTTSSRMDAFTEAMLRSGIRGLIGKGKRSNEVKELLIRHKAVYFASYGGAGAYLYKKITSSSIIAFDDLGPEAVYRLEVRNFPVIVINDIYGGDLYESAVSIG